MKLPPVSAAPMMPRSMRPTSTRGSPMAPSRIASRSPISRSASGGIVSPVSRKWSAPYGIASRLVRKPNTSSAASRTFRPSCTRPSHSGDQTSPAHGPVKTGKSNASGASARAGSRTSAFELT